MTTLRPVVEVKAEVICGIVWDEHETEDFIPLRAAVAVARTAILPCSMMPHLEVQDAGHVALLITPWGDQMKRRPERTSEKAVYPSFCVV